jgi:hypothetical protein
MNAILTWLMASFSRISSALRMGERAVRFDAGLTDVTRDYGEWRRRMGRAA